MLFAAKISRYLSPLFRFPFQKRVAELVFPQPLLRAGNPFKQNPVALGLFQLGVAFFLGDPFEGIHTVGVDWCRFTALMQQRQRMYNRQKLTNVVGALRLVPHGRVPVPSSTQTPTILHQSRYLQAASTARL